MEEVVRLRPAVRFGYPAGFDAISRLESKKLSDVFVVGASGVLGRELLPLLRASGRSVRALARKRRSADIIAARGGDPVGGDLLEIDADELAALIDGCDGVVHVASAIPRDPRSVDGWATNSRLRIEGTRTLLRAASLAGVGRYVQQSVNMIYADGGDAWLDEDAAFDREPSRSHIVSPLIEMERLVRSSPRRMNWCILRGGHFVGPGTFEDVTRESLRSGSFRMGENGERFFSPVSVYDMARAVVLSLERAPCGSIFNVNREPTRWGDYVDGVALAEGVERPPRGRTASRYPSRRCDAERIGRTIDWRASGD